MNKYVKNAKQADFGLSKIKDACQINKTGLPKNIVNIDENIFDIISESLTVFDRIAPRDNAPITNDDVFSTLSITHNDGSHITCLELRVGSVCDEYYRGIHTVCLYSNGTVIIRHIENRYYLGRTLINPHINHTRPWGADKRLGRLYVSYVNITKEVRIALSK